MKPTGILTSNPAVADAVNLRCDGSHRHEPVEGAATKPSENYPPGLAERVAKAMLSHAKCGGGVLSNGAHAEAVGGAADGIGRAASGAPPLKTHSGAAAAATCSPRTPRSWRRRWRLGRCCAGPQGLQRAARGAQHVPSGDTPFLVNPAAVALRPTTPERAVAQTPT